MNSKGIGIVALIAGSITTAIGLYIALVYATSRRNCLEAVFSNGTMVPGSLRCAIDYDPTSSEVGTILAVIGFILAICGVFSLLFDYFTGS